MKAALHVSSAAAGRLPLCRERQAAAVGAWLAAGLAAGRGGSLYVSGLPGTGAGGAGAGGGAWAGVAALSAGLPCISEGPQAEL